MISLPTIDGVIKALKALLESSAVIAAIWLIGHIIYLIEEKRKK